MSSPADPRYEPPPIYIPESRRDPNRTDSANAVWGWIAGGIVMVLLLLFIFGGSPDRTDTTAVNTPSSTASPPRPAPPAAAQAPQPAPPSTTGQGTPR